MSNQLLSDGIIIHIMEKEGIIRELAARNPSSTIQKQTGSQKSSSMHHAPLAEVVSAASSMSLVYGLELRLIQYTPIEPKGMSFSHPVPNDIQILFNKQTEESPLLNASAVIWSFRDIDLRSVAILNQVVHFYKGIYDRKGLVDDFGYYRELMEFKLHDLALELMIEPQILHDGLKPEQADDEGLSTLHFGCIGIFHFAGAVIEQYTCQKGHLIADSTISVCPNCGTKVFMQYSFQVQSLSFSSLASQLRPSDSLRYVIQWPRIGERIIHTLVATDIWPQELQYLLLIPRKMLLSDKRERIVTLWNYNASNKVITVAVLSENPIIVAKELLYPLKEHNYYLNKYHWDFATLNLHYGLSVEVDNQNIIDENGKLDASVLADLDFR